MLDLAIIGGDVVDGTGAPRRRADLGVRDGRIVAIGTLDEEAERTVDASGRIVAPGFIDVHTHYDAQVVWDPYLTPSPLHGVTTVLGGNCGFTLAPMEPNAADYLTELLARVEGMPLQSVRAGVDFRWRTFGEYLDTLEGNLGLNAGFLVGHSTVRRIVLGEDWRRPATEDEIERMCTLVDESLAAGALGFSSSYSDTHNDQHGDPTPSRFATEDELLRLCAVVSQHPGTWLEFIPVATGPFSDETSDLMARMSATAQRPLNWNLLILRPDLDDAYVANRLGSHDAAVAKGGAVYGLTLPMPQVLHVNLDSGFLFDSSPAWAEVLGRPHDEKLRLFADADVRRRLAEAARTIGRVWYDPDLLRFEHVSAPEHADLVGRTIAQAAADRGVDPWDLMFDVAVADDLATGFVVPPQGDDDETWKRRAEVWNDPRAIVGGSDAGAHLDMLSTFAFFTDFVGPVVRDRRLIPLERAVQLITDTAAQAFGLTGRGRIHEGYAADLVVFDEHDVGTGPVEQRADMPAGGVRLYAEARGVDHVFVNGVQVVDAGELTEARSGTVLRSGRDTETVAVG